MNISTDIKFSEQTDETGNKEIEILKKQQAAKSLNQPYTQENIAPSCALCFSYRDA